MTVVVVVIAVVAIVVITSGRRWFQARTITADRRPRDRARAQASREAGPRTTAAARPPTRSAPGNGTPGDATVPILMYHVINDPPAGAPYPLLYVPAAEFDAQMQALKDAGWVGVTLDQL